MEGFQSQPRQSAAKALSAENLARDFAAKADVARHGVRALCETILVAGPPELQQWKALFGQASGYGAGRTSAKIEKLAAYYLPSVGHIHAPPNGRPAGGQYVDRL